MPRILIITSGTDSLQILGDRLERDGFIVDIARAVQDTPALMALSRYDAIVVDTGTSADAPRLIRHLHITTPFVPILALSESPDESEILRALASGADDCTPRATAPLVLHAKVEALIRRLNLNRPHGAPAAWNGPPRHRTTTGEAAERQLTTLTGREEEVAVFLQQGMSNKAIARRLGIEPGTVKCHVHAVLAKLGLTKRSDLASIRISPTPRTASSPQKPDVPGSTIQLPARPDVNVGRTARSWPGK